MKQRDDLYMLPVGDPHIKANRNVFEVMANAENHTLRMRVLLEDVEEGRCGSIQKLLMSLQHYPHLIEKLLFSFEFDFIEDDATQIEIPVETWKSEPVFYHWFQKLMGTPFVLFFIADEDARYCALMADMITSGELESEVDPRDGRTGVTFNEEQGRKIVQRVFNACLNMLQFCHYSDFDPRVYIEAMMASLDVQFTYDELLSEYEHFVDNMHFKVVENEQ
jgi:hypothetical protein